MLKEFGREAHPVNSPKQILAHLPFLIPSYSPPSIPLSSLSPPPPPPVSPLFNMQTNELHVLQCLDIAPRDRQTDRKLLIRAEVWWCRGGAKELVGRRANESSKESYWPIFPPRGIATDQEGSSSLPQARVRKVWGSLVG